MAELTSDEARAASAHARINLPLNLENWKDVPEEFHADLLWFHQYALDHNMTRTEVSEAVDYDWNTVYQFLKGISDGSYKNFCGSIRSFRKIAEERGTIQQQAFVLNSLAEIVFAALDYAQANRCMTLLVGESGMGKSTVLQAWRNDEKNRGRSVYVDCPPVGGNKGFLSAIAMRVGVNKNLPTPAMLDAVVRSFNPNRILLLDNMHRCVPVDPRSPAKAFDIVQHVFDASGCAVAMSSTARLDGQMRHSHFMFEQTTGRIGAPIYLPTKVHWEDVAGIVTQYVAKPNAETRGLALSIANGPGHIRQLVERLKLASRLAGKKRQAITDEHFLMAIRIRAQLSKHNPNERTGSKEETA